MAEIIWRPNRERIERSLLRAFMRAAPGQPDEYEALWRWSVDEPGAFWAAVWEFCGVRAQRGYDEVMDAPRMPGTRWFLGSQLNYAEHLLARDDDGVAVHAAGEGREDETVTWRQLRRRVARAQKGLLAAGVRSGDRVAGLVSNTVEALVAMLATTALGAIWSSCSPDFGAAGIVDRFGQIRPKMLIAHDAYRYNGATYPLDDKIAAVREALGALEHLVVVETPFGGGATSPMRSEAGKPSMQTWAQLCDHEADEPSFAALAFDHPLAVLYSSGTTGPPKSIVHGVGGTLLKHLCEHQLQCDVRRDDVVFWFTTCGWMMWNWLVSALASGATVVLYDGSPAADGIETLWRLAERAGITHFGTSPKFLTANATAGLAPGQAADLSSMRWLLSTGAPLSPEQFDWVYEHVKADVHLASISGGTDLIGCFAAGSPVSAVRRGELACRVLGMAVEAYNDDGEPVIGEKGELVCTRPFPSMPLGFWNDPDSSRYHAAYFERFEGVWAHGDYVELRSHGGMVIHGRSDTTLNPGGVRIGTAEIYRALEGMSEVADAIVVGRKRNGDEQIVLCVQPAMGSELSDELVERIKAQIRSAASPRHVPHHVVAVDAVPYTLSGKKVEQAVARAIAGEPVANRDALANPDALDQYERLPLPA